MRCWIGSALTSAIRAEVAAISDLLFSVWVGILGLIFGSFATVAVHRIPMRQSIVSGRSMCPNCGRTITAMENVPVLSYLLLRGRCRRCRAVIPFRYPAVELITGTLFGLTAYFFGTSWETAVLAAFFWVLVVLTFIDLEHKLLPNRIVYPTFVGGWAALSLGSILTGRPGLLWSAAIGAVVFGGFLFLVAFVYPAGMGGGDVKLAFVLGTFLGYVGGLSLVVAGMFLSFVLGGLLGIVIMLVTGQGRKAQIPFGPWLALGTTIAIFWGKPLVAAYLGTF